MPETNKEITMIPSTTPIQLNFNQTIQQNEFALAAVNQYGEAFQHADESLDKDKEVALAAVTQNGIAFQHVDESFKKDKEVTLAAVNHNGWALQLVDESLKKDKKFVLTAVKKNSMALAYAYPSIKYEVKKMMETNEKLTKAFVQFSMGFNDQNSAHSVLIKDLMNVILAYGKTQLY